ncbi:MG2 domain-containing protein [Aquimarina sp. RZ0]|uniref:alpha-2-macroglobulin family protein n=1 Tax=Aquimarina sp. RZ0 TaxID=2607730 RepID=UPI0011F3B5A3|nr:MG2 domain-containing protein [Aquimarina sp. RZ0]KAA1242481.1 alpha-2-macroglobulin [Aquimarina sp. RZ0]
MKNQYCYFISLFLLLTFTTISNAQYKYDKLWAKIENLELEGKTRSASERIDYILKIAKKDNNDPQLIKSFFYKAKYELLLKDDADAFVYELLKSEIKKSSFPTRNILESILAKNLENYLDSQAYKIRNRTSIDSIISKDYKTWDINTLKFQIHQHYQNSLKEHRELGKIKDTVFSKILLYGDNDLQYKNTLYDLLANRALNFYDSNLYYSNKKNNFSIKSAHYTIPSVFKNYTLKNSESFSTMQSALQIFQNLEKIHAKGNDNLSLVMTALERLRFLQRKKPSDQNLYLNALKKLQTKYTKEPKAQISLQLARYYQKNMNLKTHPNYNEKALQLSYEISKEFPKTVVSTEANKLITFITNPHLKITSEGFIIPNKPSRVLIEYKNIDSIHLSFYKVPIRYYGIRDFYYNIDSLLTVFTEKHTAIQKVVYGLPKNKYYVNRTTEIILPKLPQGKYIIIAQKDASKPFKNSIYGINYIQSTSLAIVTKSTNKKNTYQVVNRSSGAPVNKAKIVLTDNDTESPFYRKLSTDSRGEASIYKGKKSHIFNTLISNNKDSLFIQTDLDQFYPRSNYNHIKDKFEAKASLFTDRSIYRPGQKIYFKGVLTQLKKNKSTPVVGEYVAITLYDTNSQEVKELRLLTNEFGSVHGEFTLPSNGLNGAYTIEIDEDYDEDSHFWDDVDFQYHEHEILVEEYKRPKFEINFDKIIEVYTFNDSIHVRGSAKAFFGGNVSNAIVDYSVKREKKYFYYPSFTAEEVTIYNETVTDQKGNFDITFKATPDHRSKPKDRHIYTYEIQVEITDINGETRNKTQKINIGYHSLVTQLMMQTNINTDSNDAVVFIDINNLNQVPIPGKGKLNIYKQHHPTRILRKRPWTIPNIQTIPEEAFIALFPNDRYTTENKTILDKQKPIAIYSVDTSKDTTVVLENISNWKEGTYIAKFDTKDPYGYDITTEQKFTVTDPRKNFLPDNRIFDIKTNDRYIGSKNILEIEARTAAKSLFVTIEAFQKNKRIYHDVIEITSGKWVIPILLKQKKDQIDIQISYVKYNCIWTDNVRYNFPKKTIDTKLAIQLETFRNKIEPGKNETWKLKVLNTSGAPASAEVLASMYDQSLDSFKEHQWQNNIKIHNYELLYYNILPNIDINTSFQNTYIRIKNLASLRYRDQNFTHNDIHSFGFNLVNPENNQRWYLNTIDYHHHIKETKGGKRLKVPGGTISGIVTDDTGVPLLGVNIIIKGTNRGTVSDFDGLFTIEANKNDILFFSHIGYILSEVKINNNKASIVMREDPALLEEVIVVGYGTTQKRSLTGAITTVSSQETSSEFDQLLSGKVTGITIVSANGAFGASSILKIRGYNTTGKNKPLVIINGIPRLKGLESIVAKDIVDLQMLKGDVAVKMYGRKAANGVIIITTKKGIEELQKIVPRKNLKETAFFFPQLQTDKKGNISFNFTSPETLTKWKFQAFAYDKQLNSRLIQSEVITQKELSVTPNPPRFLRQGDTISLSAKITNLNIKKMNGLVSLQLIDEISQKNLQSLIIDSKQVQNFTVDARQNASANWKIHIPENVKAIRYTICAKAGKFSDGEESILPVLSNNLLVTESIPIWVRPGEKKTYGFDKMAKQTSTTQKNHQLTIEYTTNPAWFAIKSLPYLMEFPYECAEQTFARYYSNEIATHILNSNPKIKTVFDIWKKNDQFVSNLEKNEELKNILIQETPWLRNAQSEKEQQTRLAELFDIVKITKKQEDILQKLKRMQDPSGGFPWFSGSNPNRYITRHLVSGLGHLKKLNIDSENIYTTNIIAKKAIAYLDIKYLENFKYQFLNNGDYYFTNDDLHYFYARSFWEEKYPISQEIKNIYNTYIPKKTEEWLQTKLFNKTILALILHRNSDQKIAKKILSTIEESAVQSTEHGMYWKENKAGWYWYQSPIETQALIIEAFSEINNDPTIIDNLKIWLLKNKQLQNWSTTKSTTEAIYALLLHGSDWLSAENTVQINFGDALKTSNILQFDPIEAGTGYLKKQWNKKDITPVMSHITVQNTSTVSQYGGYYWQYFEDLDKITSAKTPLQLKKKLFLKKNTDTGEEINEITDKTQLQLGDLIRVRIELKSDRAMEFIHMKDMRASGLEPVNVISQYKWQDGLGYYESTKDAATNFFIDYLPKGVYVFEYDLRVNNKGGFSNGITTIQSMYAPEFRSHSEGVRIKIK